jgi:hypothetical protein
VSLVYIHILRYTSTDPRKSSVRVFRTFQNIGTYPPNFSLQILQKSKGKVGFKGGEKECRGVGREMFPK